MVARTLPPAQWEMLDGTELEDVWKHLDPKTARVVVIEDEGAIIACWALFPLYHVEGIYIHPDHRGRGRVLKHLMEHMGAVAESEGVTHVTTGCLSDQVRELLEHFGAVEVPGQQFTFPVAALTGEV